MLRYHQLHTKLPKEFPLICIFQDLLDLILPLL